MSSRVHLQEIQAAFDDVATTNDYAGRVTKQLALVNKLYAALSPTDKADSDVKTAMDLAAAAKTDADSANTNASTVVKNIPLDPPIDSIAHQVQFIVLANVNATPNWSLVNFKGPSANGAFASLSDTKTHTLNIALGAPGTSVKASDDQLRQLFNLHLDALRSQTGQ